MRWAAASFKLCVRPIVQHVVVEHNIQIGGIESHKEYEKLRRADPRGEGTFILKGQEAHNKNTKAFCNRARETTRAFFSTARDTNITHVRVSVFRIPRGDPLMMSTSFSNLSLLVHSTDCRRRYERFPCPLGLYPRVCAGVVD
jgi:hypothetical protein